MCISKITFFESTKQKTSQKPMSSKSLTTKKAAVSEGSAEPTVKKVKKIKTDDDLSEKVADMSIEVIVVSHILC